MSEICASPPHTARRFLALPVAARRLRLPWSAVIALIRTGELDARLTSGRRWFISAPSLLEYRRARRRHQRESEDATWTADGEVLVSGWERAYALQRLERRLQQLRRLTLRLAGRGPGRAA